MRWLTFALCLCLTWTARADEVERFTLPNGLRVVLAPNQHHSRAMLLVRYAVGHRDDPKGYRGLAHLTEHLTFTQLDGLAEMEKLGASEINGITMPDETVYTAYLPRRSLQTALWLEASRMAFQLDRLSERQVANEEEIVVAEWRERRHNSGDDLVGPQIARALYPETHPYHVRGDDPDDVRFTKLPHVQWFAQQHYRPERATVVVVGAFDLEQVRGWTQLYFGAVRATGAAQPRPHEHAPAPLAKHCVLDLPMNYADEVLHAVWLGPARFSDDAMVMRVIERLLDGHSHAPLLQLAQEDPQVATTSFERLELELASEIHVMIEARAPTEAEALVPKLNATLRKVQHGQLNDGVPAAVRSAIELAEREQTRLAARASALAEESTPTLAQLRARLARVTGDDVVRVARKWLDPQRRVLVYLTGRNVDSGRAHVDCEPTP
ncbi:MAG: pitrilysin family protein [Polyangiales bacterium]